MNSTDPNLFNRKRNIALKYRPIFEALKEKLILQIVRRELFIKEILNNRDQIYQDFEQNLKK